jgi:VIT1/CCC1 family predicted Fe2+/Mn2+ transporter
MTTDRIAQLILSALSVALLIPVILSLTPYRGTPTAINLALFAISLLLLLTAWATKRSFREKFIIELSWLFPDGK